MKVSNEGQSHFLTLFFQVLYILCLYEAQISGERLQDHWSSGLHSKTRFTGLYICSKTYIHVARKNCLEAVLKNILNLCSEQKKMCTICQLKLSSFTTVTSLLAL